MLSTGALAVSVSGGTASADTLTFAVDGVTSSTSTEQMKTEQADAVRVAADRSATNAQRSVVAARSAQREKVAAARAAQAAKVKAAALAKARKAVAERAAAAAQRKRVVANAQRTPGDRPDPGGRARLVGEPQFSCLDPLWKRESGWNYRA